MYKRTYDALYYKTNRLPTRKVRAPRFELAGLSGLPRLLVHEYAWTLLFGGGGAVAIGIAAFVVTRSPGEAGLKACATSGRYGS